VPCAGPSGGQSLVEGYRRLRPADDQGIDAANVSRVWSGVRVLVSCSNTITA